jgi:ribosomal protein L44E
MSESKIHYGYYSDSEPGKEKPNVKLVKKWVCPRCVRAVDMYTEEIRSFCKSCLQNAAMVAARYWENKSKAKAKKERLP